MAIRSCPWCRQRFRMPEAAPPRVRCPGCRRVVDLAAAAVEPRWYVGRDGKTFGPYSRAQLQALAERGKLRPDDQLQPVGGSSWQRADGLPGLFAAPQKAAPAPRRLSLLGALLGAGAALALVVLLAGGWWLFARTPSEEYAEGPPATDGARVPPKKDDGPGVPKKEPPAKEPPKKNPDPPVKNEPPSKKKPPEPTPAEQQADVLRRLNTARTAAGLDAVADDATLSADCAAHAAYLARNLGPDLPAGGLADEDPTRPGFSEEGRRAARVALAAVGTPVAALERWLSRPASRIALLAPGIRHVGLGVARGAAGWVCVLDVTRGTGAAVVLYPAPGQIDVPSSFSGGPEVADPKAAAGYPVTATFPPAAKVAKVEATLRDDAGKSVDVWLSTPERPVVPRGQRNSVALIAKAPLRAGATYRARVACTWDGAPWEKEWRFTVEPEAVGKTALARRAIERLNAHRKSAGLGPVALDEALSIGCLAHARYLVRNAGHAALAGLGAHDEDLSLPEASAAGRRAGRASNIAIDDYDPLNGLDAWMATLYHRVPLLDRRLQKVGFAAVRGRRLGWVTVLNATEGRAVGPAAEPVICPAAGAADVPLCFTSDGEEPDPLPLDPDGRAGYPITATFPKESPLRKARATLTDATGRAVPCWISSPEKPANPKFVPHQGTTICLIAKDPLKPATSYRVTIEGERSGTPFTKTWQFTTSAAPDSDAAADAVVARLNAVRKTAGLRPVTRDTALSVASARHAAYLCRNADVILKKGLSVNVEDPRLPGFTPEGSAAAQQSNVFLNAPRPELQIDDLLATFLRRVFLLDPELRTVGVGVAPDVGRGWHCVLDLAGGRGDRRVVLYPAPEQKDVPCAGPDMGGYPITVTFPTGTIPRSAQVVLTDADGKEIDIAMSTPKDVPCTIVIAPRTALRPGGRYTVTVAAVVGGTEWRQRWSFTTRPTGRD